MADFEKALAGAKRNEEESQRAFERAVTAARLKKSLDLREQAKLETFPLEQRGAVLAFIRLCAGQKIPGGPIAKQRALAFFIQGFRIAEAAYGPQPEAEA